MYDNLNKWDLLQAMSNDIARLGDRIRFWSVALVASGLLCGALPVLLAFSSLHPAPLSLYLLGCGLGGAVTLSLGEIQVCLTRQLTLIRMRSVVLSLPDDACFDQRQVDMI